LESMALDSFMSMHGNLPIPLVAYGLGNEHGTPSSVAFFAQAGLN